VYDIQLANGPKGTRILYAATHGAVGGVYFCRL
jgi:hypothetical protein